jgi:hypothetical protein
VTLRAVTKSAISFMRKIERSKKSRSGMFKVGSQEFLNWRSRKTRDRTGRSAHDAGKFRKQDRGLPVNEEVTVGNDFFNVVRRLVIL